MERQPFRRQNPRFLLLSAPRAPPPSNIHAGHANSQPRHRTPVASLSGAGSHFSRAQCAPAAAASLRHPRTQAGAKAAAAAAAPRRVSSMTSSGVLTGVIVLGGALALAAVVLSVRHIVKHLSHYSKPLYQRHIVRILAMVPIYSLTSWSALVLEDERAILVLELVRDSYEAYVVYNFVVLLIAYGGGDLPLSRFLEAQPRMSHPWPGKLWLPPLKLGPAFLNSIRASVLQFVFIKPAGSLLKLYVFNHQEHAMRSVVIVVLTVINNLSVSCALYGLVLFYHAAHELLLPFQPFEKFLSVKAVVFFSFWQGAALSIAVRVGLLHDVEGFTANEQATGLQDFLICLEMAIAAVAHYYVFSYKEYLNGADLYEGPGGGSRYPLLQVVDFRDVLVDAKHRFYGGVGFESELREEGHIDSGLDDVFDDGPPTNEQYPRPHAKRSVSVSSDLLTSPWRLRQPPS